eukprot:542776_1
MTAQRDELVKIFYFLWLAIITLILTPLIIYYSVEFWRLKHKIHTFEKRYPKYVIVCVSVILFHVLILRTIADLPEILNMQINNQLSTLYFRLVLYYTIHIIYIMLLIRAWFLYIDYTKNEHLITLSWQQQISQDNTFVPWTLRYKWLHNIKLICLFAAVYWILVVIAVHIAFNFAEHHQDIASTLSYIIIVSATLIITYKIHKCKDDLFIHLELRFSGIIILIMIPMTLILFRLLDRAELLAITITIFVDICLFTIALLSTKYIIYKYRKQTILLDMKRNGKAYVIRYGDTKLTDVLETKDGFDLFASFLVQELSIEHLTYLFQIMQLKYNVRKNLRFDDVGLFIKIGGFYMKNVKQSNVVLFETYVYETISFILFNYIQFNAPFSINISSIVRRKILKEMEDILEKYNYMKRSESILKRAQTQLIDQVQMIEIETQLNIQENKLIKDNINSNKLIKCVKAMDDAIGAVLTLLSSDSYMRFVQTSGFEKLVKEQPQLIQKQSNL